MYRLGGSHSEHKIAIATGRSTVRGKPDDPQCHASGLTGIFLVLSRLSDAAAPDQFGSTIEHARLQDDLKLDGELFHVQGLDLDSRRIWVTSVDRMNRKGISTNSTASPARSCAGWS